MGFLGRKSGLEREGGGYKKKKKKKKNYSCIKMFLLQFDSSSGLKYMRI